MVCLARLALRHCPVRVQLVYVRQRTERLRRPVPEAGIHPAAARSLWNVLLGRLHGVATPCNEALQRILGISAASGEVPGTRTVDAVLAHRA
jgi:hypothetical protein